MRLLPQLLGKAYQADQQADQHQSVIAHPGTSTLAALAAAAIIAQPPHLIQQQMMPLLEEMVAVAELLLKHLKHDLLLNQTIILEK
jgi:hypothetical protein